MKKTLHFCITIIFLLIGITSYGTEIKEENLVCPTATISYSSQMFCTSSSMQNVTLTGTDAYLGGTFSSMPLGLNLNPITGAFNPTASAPGVYTITYTIAAGSGCPSFQTTTTVTISEQIYAGTDGSTTVCETSTTPINLFDIITDEQQGGTWTRVSGAGGTFNATTGIFTPAIGATTSSFIYNLSGTAPCIDDYSVATVYINQQPNAGLDGSITVCEGSTTPINLFSLIGGEQPGGTWVRTAGTGGTFNAAAGTFTTDIGCTTSLFEYTLVGVAPCVNDSSFAIVNIGTGQANATISGSTTICAGTTAILTITGTPGAVITFSDQSNTTTVVLTASGSASISVAPAITTTYTLLSADLNGCSTPIFGQSATVIVNQTPQFVNQIPDMNLCDASNLNIASQLTSTIPGTTYFWSANTSNLSSLLISGDETNIDQVATLTNSLIDGTITLTIVPKIGNCFGIAQEIIITVNPLPNLFALVDGEITIDSDGNLITPYILDTGISSSMYYSFEWYLNSTIITGATSNTFTAVEDGEYSVLATDLNTGCSFLGTAIVTENIQSGGLISFSDPLNDTLNFRNSNKVKTIQISNQLGQVVLTLDINSKNGSIDLSELNMGIYNIAFDTENGTENQRFIKQ